MKWNFSIIAFASVLVAMCSAGALGQILNESAKLVPSDGAASDRFGYSISVSGGVAIVGAYLDDDNGNQSGSAYVFRWNGSTWVEEEKLLPSDGATSDLFGNAVSVSADVSVVGAEAADANGSNNSGSAYVFRWNGSAWVEEGKLLPSDGTAGDWFGGSVCVSGNVAVVERGNTGGNFSSAYVFRWDGSMWVEEQTLIASDAAAFDDFGYSVSVSGDVAVVGAYSDDDNGLSSGSAYIFRWNGVTWVQEQKLVPSDGSEGDEFGRTVSVSGDVAVVGAYLDDDNGSNSGSAYVFRWNGSAWIEEQKLLASDGAVDDRFGGTKSAVAIAGDVIVVGAPLDDDNGSESGSAYVFRWNGSAWVETQKLLASDGELNDGLGWSVSVSGDVAVVGAHADDDNGSESGSAYVFNLTCGNGLMGGAEECDDGGGADGDGCSSTCTVESGYTCDANEPSICTDINECAMGTDDCSLNGTCVNTPGTFLCDCDPGWTGTDCSIAMNAPGWAPAPHDRPKNRYISFSPNNSTAVAFQVRRVAPGAAVDVGWVGTPDANGIAKIEAAPVHRVWTESEVHAGDCEIIPVATYEVSSTVDEIAFSPALAINTIAQPAPKWWGDTVGGFVAGAWEAPNGVVNANDFVAALQGFQVLASAPHVSVTDVQSGSANDPCLNRSTNFADVFLLIKAFQGDGYPFTVIPATCPPCP